MDTTAHIQTLAKIALVLLVFSIVADTMLAETLPDLLQQYLHEEFERDLTALETVGVLFALPALIAFVASLFGFIYLRAWAARTYVYSVIVLSVAVVTYGPQVINSTVVLLNSLSGLTMGAILAMLYTTPSYFSSARLRSGEDDD